MVRSSPQHWLLFQSHADTGLAVQLEHVIGNNGISRAFTYAHKGGGFGISLGIPDSHSDFFRDLQNSAEHGGRYGYELLQSEGIVKQEASFRFQFEGKYRESDQLRNIRGTSADLLFGLAVVTAAKLNRNFSPFAATGRLSEEGQVLPVQGLQAKIDAALLISALHGQGIIFYPKENDKEIDADLRYRAEQVQVRLFPVCRLEDAVEQLGISIKGTWTENPYRHLNVFTDKHHRIYFGREYETLELVNNLLQREKLGRPSLLILGPSGGGKSSLVQAGLIPELKERLPEGSLQSDIWDLRNSINQDLETIAYSIRSSWANLYGLAALSHDSHKSNAIKTSADLLTTLAGDLVRHLPNQMRFVWVLDQLEQFFNLKLNVAEKAAFLDFVQELKAQGIWIVATFRNDFYSTLQAHDGLLGIFDKNGHHDIENLSETAIERIIQEPAKLAKVTFEQDDRSSELLSLRLKNDALRGSRNILPLLEFALYQLYENRDHFNDQMTYSAYKSMGGLQGAIGKHADKVLDSLKKNEQETLGRVLRALAKLRRDSVETESGNSPFIADVASLKNFPPNTPARHLINAFTDARLFVSDRDNEGIAQVRVTHEALFTHWPKAKEMLIDSMRDFVVRERLTDTEAHWKINQEDTSLLLQPGLPLEEAQDLLARWGDDELSPDIIHYINQSSSADQERKQSESKAQQRKTRFAVITAVVLGILLLISAGTAYLAEQRGRELAQTLAYSYFNEGVLLVENDQPKEALVYLARAIRFDSKPDSAAARLAASLFIWPKHNINISAAQIDCHEQESIVQFNARKDFIFIACGNKLQIWSARTGKSITELLPQESKIVSAKFSPDGYRIIIFLKGGKAQILDTSSGKLVSQLLGLYLHAPSSAQFSPDGLKVVVASSNVVQVWDTAKGGEPLLASSEFAGIVETLEFSPNGKTVFVTFENYTTTQKYTAQVWDVVSGKDISLPMEHESPILSAQFSSDGHYIMTRALWDNIVRVWDAATGELVTNSIKHENYIESVQFSPDGRWVLTASIDNTAQVWDSVTGKQISKLMIHKDSVLSAVFSPDGRTVVTASADKTARVWDAATGIPITKPILHENYVKSVRFSPDGLRLLTISGDKIAQVWNTWTGKPASQQFKHAEHLDSAQFNSDGNLLITVSYSAYSNKSTARVWNVVEGRNDISNKGYKDYIDSASYSHDGKWIVTINDDKTAQVWNAITREPVLQPMVHKYPILSAQFSSNKHWVITILEDETAQVWDAVSGTEGYDGDYASYLESVQLSPDGHWVTTVANNKSAQVWDAATESMVSKPKWLVDYVRGIHFSPDKRRILTISIDDLAQVWDAVTGKLVSQISFRESSRRDYRSSEFSMDGRYVFTAFFDTVKIWEAGTGKLISHPIKKEDKIIVNNIRFSPDGHRLITSSDSKIHIWDVATGNLLLNPVEGVDFSLSQDGSIMIAISMKTARVIDLFTGNLISKLMHYEDYINSVQFSPDGRRVITISRDNNAAQIWNTTTGAPISKPIKHEIIESIQFSPDGRNLLTISDRSSRVWNAFTGAPISKLMQHKQNISIARFSPDSRWVMTASNDKSVRVWDTTTGNPVSQPMQHTDPVTFAGFSPDKCCVVTTSRNKLRIWDIETGNPISAAIKHDSLIRSAYFSSDDRHIVTVSNNTSYSWEIPLFPAFNNVFIEFLDRVSGYSINEANSLQEENDVTKTDLRNWTNATNFSSLEYEFINWWLGDPIERTVSPYSKKTVKEHIQFLIDHNSIGSLNRALDFHPGHPMALAKLAALTWSESEETEQQDYIRPRVALWANLALKYAPDDTSVGEVAEKVLQNIAQPN